MDIKLAEHAGFCFGVGRAIQLAEESAKAGRVFTFGPVIHNPLEVERLKAMGLNVLLNENEAAAGDTVIIRSHGVSSEVENKLIEKGVSVVDATCPFVKKIHKIVSENYRAGRKIVIVGDNEHPEVLGINGWCDNSGIIISSVEEAKVKINPEDKLCVVSQTTANRVIWEKVIKIVKNTCKDARLFDTICHATNIRQKEARELAESCDCVIVIGGKNSSNTSKLADICKERCKYVYHIEDSTQLNDIPYDTFKSVGITAGASTPDWIIKEVVNTMEEKSQTRELSFAEEFEKSLITLNTGDVVKGTVIGITPTEVYVDLGYKADGVISASEISDNPDVRIEDFVKVGGEIEVFVIRVSDVEGTVGLSIKKLEHIKGWNKINEAFANGQDLEGKVIEAVQRGVIALCEGYRVFIPASQASDKYLSDLNSLVGQTVPIRILEVNKGRKKVVGSVKQILIEEKDKKTREFWGKIDEGIVEFTGTVKTLTNFGAFVDLGGVDGLIHISELSWGKIKHPSEVLNEGDAVTVTILSADKEKGKISLGFKKAEENPWNIAKSKFNVGDVVNAKVVRLVPFGAFVELLPGIDGLIHISQIANKRIGKPSDELSVGQEVEAKITEIDWDKQKVALSIRELLPAEEAVAPVKDDASEETEPTEHIEEMSSTISDSMGELTIEE